jgi:hypothetical protein
VTAGTLREVAEKLPEETSGPPPHAATRSATTTPEVMAWRVTRKR